MKPNELVFQKPSPAEILEQITPFVTDERQEATFSDLVERRKKIARRIVSLAREDPLTAETFQDLLKEDPDETLGALISLLGLSQEEFFRHITLARIEQLGGELLPDDFSEWKVQRISKEIFQNRHFATKLLSLLLHGYENSDLAQRVPSFLREKLNISKLRLEPEAVLDTLMRTGLKGRYDAMKGNPLVNTITAILDSMNVPYKAGEISVPGVRRRLDVVMPHEGEPHVLLECGVFATTARELSEKGLVESQVQQDVREHYPQAVLVRVVDGVGWIARGGNALKNVIDASDYILTQKTLHQLWAIAKQHLPPRYLTGGSM